MTHRFTLPLTLLFATMFAHSALAGDTCTDGYEQGQVLRKSGELLSAREKFRACVNTCTKDVLKTTCGGWLAEVENDVPTVVLSATDGAERALVDVRVSMDGRPFATKLDGRPVELDPGQHTFVFSLADGTKHEVSALLMTGTKNQIVLATIGKAAAAKTSTSSVSDPPQPANGGSPMKLVGFIVGGAGIVGLGVGGFFGLRAMSKNNDANCDSDSVCANPQSRKDAQSAATISTVGVVGGALLAGAGLTMVLLAPKEQTSSSIGLSASPLVASGTGGLLLTGRF